MDERRPGDEAPPEEAPQEIPQAEPTVEHFRMVERRERLNLNAAGFRLAKEAIDNSLAQQTPLLKTVMETAETAKVGDLTTRRNAQTAGELAELVFQTARRVREELTAPAPAPRPGGFEILVGGVVKIVDSLFGGSGEDLLEAGIDKLKQLGAAAGAAGPAPAPAAGAEAQPRRQGPSVAELAVITDQLPPDVADTLTMGELRELSELLARLRGEGKAADVRQVLAWLRAQRGAG